jgi:hypothetical protein
MQSLTDKNKEGLVTAIYVGSVFILVALVYFVNIPNNLWGRMGDFFGSFIFSQVPNTGITLPVPANPAAYSTLYVVAFQFSLGVAIIEILILSLRILVRSPIARKAETIENIVFWFGASYLTITYLVNMTLESEWFAFWSGIILIAGMSLIARAIVLLAARR